MNKFASKKAKEELKKIITDQIKSAPFERGGFKWAKVHQEPLAEHLKISTKTLHRWTSGSPFQRTVALDDDVKVTLLRVLEEGDKPIKTAPDLANIMRKIWVEKTGKELDRTQHGCLIGLAKDWPDGYQVKIFKTVLSDWETYASAMGHFIAWHSDTSAAWPVVYKGKPLYKRYYGFPTITYMRTVPEVAVAVYAMKLQADGKPVPATVLAIYDSLKAFG